MLFVQNQTILDRTCHFLRISVPPKTFSLSRPGMNQQHFGFLRDESPQRESRFRCGECGGETKFAGNYPKSPHFIVTYRVCQTCGARWEWHYKQVGKVEKEKIFE